ncbi:hypothetical protein EVC45_38210 [Paraburkholderia sp. UYCP14C]|uniref:DUF6998 domain-containing protein n=1 Tax=Paraburkholderia sp. UYCP14C TaxID=2511130 RepID=UPI001021E385|nr:hypothetical protein [Paraburkholderia sp. UYCP14C]RZF24570.1 hypothetical protein EVC45_38210 [Paraburkholderia sp. UYCP14C]
MLPLPEVVRDLWASHKALVRHYAHTGLTFTLDGRLVGDIAEALALEHFDLVLPLHRTGGVDALTRSGRTVQVKATGSKKSGPAFTPGDGVAEYLLFMRIDFHSGTASVLYNGPEAPIRAFLPAEWKGTKVVRLAQVLHAAKAIDAAAGLPRKVSSG